MADVTPIIADAMEPRPRGVKEAQQKRRKPRVHRTAIRLTPSRSITDIVFANAHNIAPTMPNPTHEEIHDICRRCGRTAELVRPDEVCASCDDALTEEVVCELEADGIKARPRIFAAYSPECITEQARGESGRFA